MSTNGNPLNRSNLESSGLGDLTESEAIVLTQAQAEQLLKMIENPPPRNPKFLEAQAWYQAQKSGL